MNVSTDFTKEYCIAFAQHNGGKPQEDCVTIFNSECIAIADGVSVMPHGDIASSFVCETAIWAYKHVRQRPYYWEEKTKLLQRIFRTTNLSLWQKRKESDFEDGLASTLCMAIFGKHKFWIGAVGDGRVYLIREGLVEELVSPESQSSLQIPMALGYQKTGILPRLVSERFIAGDVLLLATDGASDVLTEEDIRSACEIIGDTQKSCEDGVQYILKRSLERGSKENGSVCMVKHCSLK